MIIVGISIYIILIIVILSIGQAAGKENRYKRDIHEYKSIEEIKEEIKKNGEI